MKTDLKDILIEIAREEIPDTDVAHDFGHASRVLSNAERIYQQEGGDLEIIIPASLFHDVIVYPKNSPLRYQSQKDSASKAEKILKDLRFYPEEKIENVKNCILECSFSQGFEPKTLESKILQDSDGLEATGAISIMRTYASSGQMCRPFYDENDPFCENRDRDALAFSIDFFFERLLRVAERMHTETARQIALRRTDFIVAFLNEFKMELEGK